MFCCTSIKFTILVLNWNEFTSYSIVLPMSNYARVFRSWSIFLDVLFMSLLKSHIRVLEYFNYCVMHLNVMFV